jgi:hypothetical protein
MPSTADGDGQSRKSSAGADTDARTRPSGTFLTTELFTGPVPVQGARPEASGAAAVASGPGAKSDHVTPIRASADERHDPDQGPVPPRNSRMAALNRSGASTALA